MLNKQAFTTTMV